MTTTQAPKSKFILLLTYVKPNDEVDVFLPAHKEFLAKGYADGHFLVSGRRSPRVGGVIVALAESLEAVRALEDADPFITNGVATYEVIEFTPTTVAPGIEAKLLS